MWMWVVVVEDVGGGRGGMVGGGGLRGGRIGLGRRGMGLMGGRVVDGLGNGMGKGREGGRLRIGSLVRMREVGMSWGCGGGI